MRQGRGAGPPGWCLLRRASFPAAPESSRPSRFLVAGGRGSPRRTMRVPARAQNPASRPPDAPPARFPPARFPPNRPRLAPGVDCLGADLAVRFRPMAGPSFTLPRVRSAAALPKPRSGRKRSPAWPIIPGSGRAVACHWRGDGWRRCGIGKAIPPPRPPAPSAPLTCR